MGREGRREPRRGSLHFLSQSTHSWTSIKTALDGLSQGELVRAADAVVKDAILEGAFAFNTKFEGATIDGADFTDVELRPDAQALLCKTAKGTNSVTGRKTRETLYCD